MNLYPKKISEFVGQKPIIDKILLHLKLIKQKKLWNSQDGQ